VFKRETEKVLDGGLMLLARGGDIIGESQAVAMVDLRVDEAGALRMRWPEEILVDVAPTAAHTIYRAWGNLDARYTGCGANLYKGSSGTPIDTGYDGEPLGIAVMNGFLWVMNRSRQKRFDGTSITAWFPTAAPAAPGLTPIAGGELVDGQTYSYYATWVTANGEETNPSPVAQTTIAAPNQEVTVGQPAAPPAEAAYWNVYRIGNTLPAAYRVNDAPIDIATTTFLDSGQAEKSDLALARLGIEMQTDRDSPPAARGLVGPYFGRLIAFNSAAHPNWFWWTPVNQPYCFPGSGLVEGNHAPVGNEGEEIVQATLHGRSLRFYKQGSVWRLTGDPGDLSGDLEKTNAEIGLVGARAICSVGRIDYLVAADGLYACDGESAVKLSQAVDPIFKGEQVTIVGADPVQGMTTDPDYRKKIAVAHRAGQIWISYPTGLATTNNATLVYHIASKRWAKDSRAFDALYDEGQAGYLLGQITTRSVLAAVEVQPTPGARYPSGADVNWQSGYRDQGFRNRKKQYAEVAVEHSVDRTQSEVQNYAVHAYLDDGATQKTLSPQLVHATTTPGASRVRTVFPIDAASHGAAGRNCAVRIDQDGYGFVPLSIYSVELAYYLLPVEALSFDSGVIDLGFPGVKQIAFLEMDIEAAATVTWEVHSDLPSNPIAQRATGTFAATSGRASVKIPVDAAGTVEGKLLRVLLSSTSIFSLAWIKVWYRRIGVYRDGANGEVWELPESAVGF
jgi:hypothetical protein